MNRKTILVRAAGTFRLIAVFRMALVLLVGAALMPVTARGQIFVSNFLPGNGAIGEYTTLGATVHASLTSDVNDPLDLALSGSDLFVDNHGNDTIGEYTTSGATVNASLIPGVSGPGIVVAGSDLFVLNGNTIGEYTLSGATVNASLISGLHTPNELAVSGSDLFVTNYDSDTIGEYTTSGATVNANLITGLSGPNGIVVSGSDLFVVNYIGGTIGEYTTSGVMVNASLISGLGELPTGLALSGSDLFVTNMFDGTVGEYTTSGGTVNADLISGLQAPWGIAVVTVPEPATGSLVLFAGMGILMRRRQKQQHA
jgi:hypothetical protein